MQPLFRVALGDTETRRASSPQTAHVMLLRAGACETAAVAAVPCISYTLRMQALLHASSTRQGRN